MKHHEHDWIGRLSRVSARGRLWRYGVALAAVVLATLLRAALDPIIGQAVPFPTYFCAIMVAFWIGGLGPALVAWIGGFIAGAFFFVEPTGATVFGSAPIGSATAYLTYLVTGLLLCLVSDALARGRTPHQLAESSRGLDEARVARTAGVRNYLVAILAVGGALATRLVVVEPWRPSHDMLFATLAVAVAAFLGGFGPGLFAVILAGALWSVFVFEPLGSWVVSSAEERGYLLSFAVVGCVMALLAARARQLRLRAEASRQQTSEILASITDSFVVFDADLRYATFNAAARRMFRENGIEADALVGRSVLEVFPSLADSETLAALRRAGSEGVNVEWETWFAPWSRWFLVRACPMPQGRLALVSQDITERKQSAAALRSGEQKMQLIGDAVPALISYVDREFRYQFCNRAYSQWFGLEASQIVGKHMREVLGEVAWNAIRPHMEKAMQGIPADFELNAAYAQGGSRWIHAVYTPHRGPDGAILGAIAMVSDVTPRKRIEEALRESEQRFRSLADSAPVFIWLYRQDATCEFANKTWVDFFGGSLEKTLGQAWQAEIHPNDAERYLGAYREAYEQRAPYRAEARIRRADGEWRWLASQGLPRTTPAGELLGYVGCSFDITELRETERARRSSEEKLQQIFDAAKDYAILSLDPEGRFNAWNSGAERIFGYKEIEIIGRHFGLIFTPGDQSDHLPEHELETAREKGAAPNERWHARKDGTLFFASGLTQPIEGMHGELLGYLKICQDQTEQHETREALRASAEAAAAASRAKDDFIAALSHELRTPLTPVLLSATELASNPELPPGVREELAMMRRNIELEARLIDDLLDLTHIRRGSLTLQPVAADVHDLLLHTRQILQNEIADKPVDVVFELEAHAPTVLADPARLQQVFWNLLRNAIKFTPARGRIVVGSRNLQRDRIEITIQDSGVGISPGAMDRIFRPFDQGDLAGSHVFGGLGLGLSISKAIIDLHRGALRASSEGIGKGARFTIELAATGREATPPAAPGEPSSVSTKLRLLVVEDHAATRDAMTRILKRDGHMVFAAGSVRDALALAATQECDGVVSDLGLPDGSGLQLMAELRRLYGWPGIALTGYGMEEDIVKTREAGFSAHLVKPLNAAQLRKAIAAIHRPRGRPGHGGPPRAG